MANWPERFEPDGIIALLTDAHVDFVVIGGIAVIAHGYVRLTRDLDVTYALSRENLQRLGDVLIALHARLRDVPDDVPFVPDGRTLRRTEILTLETDLGWLDLLAKPPGAPPYDELKAAAFPIAIAGVQAPIASVPHLLAMKRDAQRPRDVPDIQALEAIARMTRRHPRGPRGR